MSNGVDFNNLGHTCVVGLHWGNYQFQQPQLIHDTHAALCDMYGKGQWKPVIWREFPLEQAIEALSALRARESHGKILLRPSQ